jgi:glutamate synthase domain-containing protein 1
MTTVAQDLFLNGIKSNDIIHKALDILIKLEHRGAVSADGRTEMEQEFF